MFYTIYKALYFYKDQYGKHIFSVSNTNEQIKLMKDKIDKYESINPIYQKDKDNNYLIKFNDTENVFKPNHEYNLTFFMHKSFSEKTNKHYINFHVAKSHRCDKKELEKISVDEL